MSDSDWVVEAALQFVRQPLWTTPVQNFIDENCVVFDDEEELKLEYTPIHKKFQALIEGILENMLSELGATPEILVEAMEAQKDTDKNIKKFLQYLYSLDDFRSFRAIMVKRNVELQEEAMAAWAKMQAYHAQQQISGDAAPAPEEEHLVAKPTPDDEEAKELELALKASLQDDEKIMKQAEVEDAELMQALALSAAEEQDRIRREEEAALAEAEKAKAEADAKAAKEASDAAVADAEKKKAEEELKRKEEEIAKKKADAEAAMKTREEEVLKERKEKIAVAVAAAEKAREDERAKNPDAPAVTRTSLTNVEKKPLPGLGEIQNHRATGGFGKFSALPSLQPSFSTLKAEVTPTVVKAEPVHKPATSEEDKAAAEAQRKAEFEARQKYLAEQRKKLIEQKKQQRDGDLSAFVKANNLSSTPEAHQPQQNTSTSKEDQEHKDMSKALLRRFKDDLIQESSKTV